MAEGGSDSGDAFRDTPTPGSRRTPRPPEDLSGEWALDGCETIAFEGEERPSLGRIALLGRLGRGGMGLVYYGVNPRLGTEVAVKVLPRAVHEEQEASLKRFLQEARLAGHLNSPHLVSVLDVDHDTKSGAHFLVMEYVRGKTAGQWLRKLRKAGEKGAPESAALALCIAATKGLAAAHREGILHRDIKPSNILIPADDDGRLELDNAKLTDLGLARTEVADQALTATNVAMGTPGFMSPEQATDARQARKPADVFSMGATLYALLAGRAPFREETAIATILRTVKAAYTPIDWARLDVSPATAELVDRCLQRRPEDRFPDAPALLDALVFCRDELRAGRGADPETKSKLIVFAKQPEQGKEVRSDPPPPKRSPPSGQPVSASQQTTVGAPPPSRRLPALVAVLIGVLLTIAVAATALLGRYPAENEPGLYVTSKPPGALVLVDGEARGNTPLFVPDLSGTHSVRMTMKGYRDYEVPRLILAAGERKELNPELERQEIEAGLDIKSTPPGATVIVDGTQVGKTPLFVPALAHGAHSVILRLEDYADHKIDDAIVEAEKQTPIDVRLERATGTFSVPTGTPGAAVRFVRRGTPPKEYDVEIGPGGEVVDFEMEAGVYDVTASAAGHDSIQRTVRIVGERTADLDIVLPEHDGTLTVVTDPPGAEVVVDGEILGTTPVAAAGLPAGAHEVELRLDEHATVARTVVIRGDRDSDLGTIDLFPWSVLDLTALGAGVVARVGGKVVEPGARVAPPIVEVVLSRAGYADQTLRVQALPGQPAVVEPEPWDRFRALLDLGELPAGAAAIVDGEPWGGRPLTYTSALTVPVVLRRPGFAEIRMKVDLALGETAGLPDLEWLPVETRIDLSDIGLGAIVTLKGKTLFDRSVIPPGEHTFLLRERGGLRRRRVTLDVVSQQFVRPPMPRVETENVTLALEWLKRHQSREGSWDPVGFTVCGDTACAGAGKAEYEVGLSALALQCFLRAGYRAGEDGPYRDVIERGLQYLIGRQQESGLVGATGAGGFLIEHAIATRTLADAYRDSQLELLREPAQSAADYAAAARNPYLGWRYQPRGGENDTIVTGWMTLALHAAERAGLTVDRAAFSGANTWVLKLTNAPTRTIGYRTRADRPQRYSDISDFNPQYSESLTAVGILVHLLTHPGAGWTASQHGDSGWAEDPRQDALLQLCLGRVRDTLPTGSPDVEQLDFYYWYHGTLALHRAGSDHWPEWRRMVIELVHGRQATGDDARDGRGSFDPSCVWGAYGGRIYSTAINCLTLIECHRAEAFFDAR